MHFSHPLSYRNKLAYPFFDMIQGAAVRASYVDHRVFGTTGFHGCIIAHCDVRPATAGVDNTITFACTNVSASAVEIVVRPYNPDLQLKWKTVADNSDVEVVPS